MQSDNAQTVILIPLDHDPISQLDKKTAKDPLRVGDVYLQASMNEMLQVVRLCQSTEEDYRELLREGKAKFDYLDKRREELELLRKHRSIFKPFKLMEVKRAIRAFADDAQGLFISTRTTSGRLKRDILSIPSADLAPIEGFPKKASVDELLGRVRRPKGLAVLLPPPGELNAPGVQEVLTAVQNMTSVLEVSASQFAGTTSSSSVDGQTSTANSVSASEASSSARSSITTSPTSPDSASSFSWLNFNVNWNIINNVASSVPGFTIHNAGSENAGSNVSSENSGST